MQVMPDSRQQSFEEIYGPPENFLEIEVVVFSLKAQLIAQIFPLIIFKALADFET